MMSPSWNEAGLPEIGRWGVRDTNAVGPVEKRAGARPVTVSHRLCPEESQVALRILKPERGVGLVEKPVKSPGV